MHQNPLVAPPAGASPISRRAALSLLGGTALWAVAGCGSTADDEATDTPGTDSSGVTDDAAPSALVQIFPASGYVISGAEQRMAFALGGATGAPLPTGVGSGLRFTVLALDGDPADSGDVTGTSLGTVDVPAHSEGVPIAYYPLRFTFDSAGYYGIRAEGDGVGPLDANITVSDPRAVALVQPGAPLPSIQTPTVDDGRGVDPICTADPRCPLHETDLTAALGSGAPTALLVSTPAFCQIGVCGPVLDLLVEQTSRYPGVQMIHCEVYADDQGPTSGSLAPIVGALGMEFEPSLYLIGDDGIVADRLDNVFDRAELTTALDALTTA